MPRRIVPSTTLDRPKRVKRTSLDIILSSLICPCRTCACNFRPTGRFVKMKESPWGRPQLPHRSMAAMVNESGSSKTRLEF